MSNTDTAGAAPQEAATDLGQEGSDFDKEFASFLAHDFGEPEGQEEPAAKEGSSEAPPKAAGEEAAEAAAAPAEPTPEPAAAPASAEPPAAKDGAPAETSVSDEPTVSQAELAAMLGFSAAAPGNQPPGQESKKEAESTTSSEPSADEPYAPFRPEFKLPPAMTAALFEADDTETRAGALVNLLSMFGNTVVQVMEQRFQDYHAPRVLEAVAGGMRENQLRTAVHNDFYGAFPELAPYKEAVQKAFQIVHKRDPSKATYNEETRKAVGELARAALTQGGIKLDVKGKVAATQTPAAKGTKVPAGKAPGNAFEAGGARPGGNPTGGDSGPADLVAELSQF